MTAGASSRLAIGVVLPSTITLLSTSSDTVWSARPVIPIVVAPPGGMVLRPMISAASSMVATISPASVTIVSVLGAGSSVAGATAVVDEVVVLAWRGTWTILPNAIEALEHRRPNATLRRRNIMMDSRGQVVIRRNIS